MIRRVSAVTARTGRQCGNRKRQSMRADAHGCPSLGPSTRLAPAPPLRLRLGRPRVRPVAGAIALVVEELAHALSAAALFVLEAHLLALGLQIIGGLLVGH